MQLRNKFFWITESPWW